MFTPKIDLLLKRMVPLALAGMLVLAMTAASIGPEAGVPQTRATESSGSKVTSGKQSLPCSWAYGRAL